MTRRDLTRGLTFDSVAARYDRYRPRYPRETFDVIEATGAIDATSRIVEVGCGPGIATEEMLARGWTVWGVDPGEELARVARAKFPEERFAVEVTTFDQWSPRGRMFDLVFSATAYHWVAPELRWRKAAEVLVEGGWLALVTNEDLAEGSFYDFTGATRALRVQFDVDDEPDAVSLEELRERSSGADDIGTLWEGMSPHGAAVLAGDLFAAPEVHFFPWQCTYSTREVLGLLGTYSRFLVMDPARREALFERFADVIDRQYGGRLTRHYVTVLAMARRYAATSRPRTP